ncbi:MAG: oligosaccharide flippase family protein, partial [Clostridia bacterium]|nr:oligosaccharide flippase family protein [Clostridia bacterium]
MLLTERKRGALQLFAPFLRGAAIISIGGLITKIIGAAYRIPLTNIIGTEGIGVYQTVFPVYAILLTFSSAGAPSALSKIISSTENKKEALKCASKVFIPAGIAGSFIMA